MHLISSEAENSAGGWAARSALSTLPSLVPVTRVASLSLARVRPASEPSVCAHNKGPDARHRTPEEY